MLTAKQKELLDFISATLAERGVSPSFQEMQDALGLASKSGVHRLVMALEERGFIRRLPNRARALEVVSDPVEQTALRGVSPPYRQSLAMFSNKALLDECFRRNLVRAA